MEKNISPVKVRILEYASNKGLSKRKIYLQTGLANGTLDKKTGLGEENIEKFISTYSDINIEWLLTGKGEMLKTEESLVVDKGDKAVIALLKEQLAQERQDNKRLERENALLKTRKTANRTVAEDGGHE